MGLAIVEARKNEVPTSPNPRVGAVIVRDGEILGRGFHKGSGQPHAEVEALKDTGGCDLSGATIYVTLEPCSTVGRTPACTSAILESGLGRVVYGCDDPNPDHVGAAKDVLVEGGIEVVSGVCADSCGRLIRGFRKWVTTGLPWVVSKAGMTLDGRLTRPYGESSIVTCEAARADAMVLRSQTDAVVIGAQTLRDDDPSLTVRGFDRAAEDQPLRVVLSKGGLLPADSTLFNDEQKSKTLVLEGLHLDLHQDVLMKLGQRGCCHVVVEGGGQIHRSFINAGLVDEVVYYIAPRICGGGVAVTGSEEFIVGAVSSEVKDMEVTMVGECIRVTGLLSR